MANVPKLAIRPEENYSGYCEENKRTAVIKIVVFEWVDCESHLIDLKGFECPQKEKCRYYKNQGKRSVFEEARFVV